MEAQARLAAAVLAGSVLVIALAACSSEADPSPANSEDVDASASVYLVPEQIEDPTEAAIAAYERYWRVVAESGSIPDPNYGPLSRVASGAALETARQLAQDALNAGERTEGGPLHNAVVTESYPEDDPYRFVISDCTDSSEWPVLDATTGEPVEGEEYGTRKVEALVERIDDRWQVTEVVLLGLGTCLGKRSDSDPL